MHEYLPVDGAIDLLNTYVRIPIFAFLVLVGEHGFCLQSFVYYSYLGLSK